MSFRRRVAASALVLGIGACAFSMRVDPKRGLSLAPSAHAQGIVRDLIARLRGKTLPDGIVKSNGRIEATQVDVSSKYAGRLAEVTVEEGSSVTKGQVIAKLTSPEYQAQLRAAQADVKKANDALAAAEAEITARQSALDFAKSDFERGQQLIKAGHITKQTFEQRKRNLDSAAAAVQSFTSQRDQALSQIANSEAEVDRIQSIIDDLTLRSPRFGRVQYQLARAGEVVAAGAPIVTVLDLTDVYMTVFLPAADAGRLAVGDEARIILDPIPDYVIPASVELRRRRRAIHAENRRDHGRAGETDVSRQAQGRCAGSSAFYTRVKTGVRGLGFMRTKADVEWPADLQVKLPKAPADKGSAAPAADSPPQASPPPKTPANNAAETKTPDAK